MKVIIFFTKIPSLGYSKSRLRGYLPDESILKLSENLIKSTFERATGSGFKIFIVYSKKEDSKFPEYMHGVEKFEQKGEDLGARMYNAFVELFEKGYDELVLIGSDVLGIDQTLIKKSFEDLEKHDLVISPTKDGGYSLIGMKKPYKPLFHDKKYSHPKVLQELLDEAKRNSLTYKLEKETDDIDDINDLMRIISNEDNCELIEYGRRLVFESKTKMYSLDFEENSKEVEIDPITKLAYTCEVIDEN